MDNKCNHFYNDKNVVKKIINIPMKVAHISGDTTEMKGQKIEGFFHKKIDFKEIVELVKKYPSMIGIILSICGSSILGAFYCLNGINARIIFSYYGLNFDIIKNTNDGFFYSLFLGIFFVGGFCLLFSSLYNTSYKIRNIFKNENKKECYFFELVLDCFFIVLFNFYIVCYGISYIPFIYDNYFSLFGSFIAVLIVLIFFILIEIIIAFILTFIYGARSFNFSKISIVLCTVKLIILIFISLLLYCYFVFLSNVTKNKSFYIMDKKTVILYTTEDYYLTLDCQIEKNAAGEETITIYKNTQNKVSTDNIKTYKREFNKVILVDDNSDATLYLEEDKAS